MGMTMGTVICALGGLAGAVFALPFRGIKDMRYESYWLIYAVFGLVAFPMCLAFMTCPHLFDVIGRTEGATLARVTAFPDVTPRKELPIPCAFLYDGKRYVYDPKIPLAEQKGGPETDSEFSFDFLMKDDPPQRGLDDFYDLGNRFGATKNSFAYLVFAVWSDGAGKATAALAAAHTWQVFQNGREVAHNVGIQEGRYMMPEWFEIDVKPGYNWLVVKVATPGWVATYRREWGAKLQVFADDDAD